MAETFYKTGIESLKPGRILVRICVHSSTSENFHLFGGKNKELLSIVRDDLVGGPPVVIACNALLTKLTFASPQLVANQFIEYMLVIFLLFQIVNNFLQGSTRDTSFKQNPLFVKTSQETAKSCRIFKKIEPTVNFGVSTQQ